MYMFWMQNCVELNRVGTTLWLGACGQWAELARTVCTSYEPDAGERWIDNVTAEAPRGSRRCPRLVNCAAGYYSCCRINLARIAPANDACWKPAGVLAKSLR